MPIKLKHGASRYEGRCPACGAAKRAFILTTPYLMPPPAIGCACNCRLPVQSVSLVYQGVDYELPENL